MISPRGLVTLSSWGYGLAPFQLGIWTGPFPVGDVDWPLSGWGYGLAPFRLGIWTGPFPVGDMDRPLSGWGYGPAPFRLGIWTGPFPVGDIDWPLSGWGYGPAPFPHLLSPGSPSVMCFRGTRSMCIVKQACRAGHMVIHSACLLWSITFCPLCPHTSFAICYGV